MCRAARLLEVDYKGDMLTILTYDGFPHVGLQDIACIMGVPWERVNSVITKSKGYSRNVRDITFNLPGSDADLVMRCLPVRQASPMFWHILNENPNCPNKNVLSDIFKKIEMAISREASGKLSLVEEARAKEVMMAEAVEGKSASQVKPAAYPVVMGQKGTPLGVTGACGHGDPIGFAFDNAAERDAYEKSSTMTDLVNELSGNAAVKTVDIPFYGTMLTAAIKDGKPYVAMRPIVEGMGLNWGSQHRNMMLDTSLAPTVVEMTTVAEDGKNREMICLPLEMVHGWLFTINPNRYKNDPRGALIKRYRDECFKVLSEHFLPQKTCVPTRVTAEMLRAWLDEYDELKAGRDGWKTKALEAAQETERMAAEVIEAKAKVTSLQPLASMGACHEGDHPRVEEGAED